MLPLLHRELIEYAVASSRLFFIHEPLAWRDWATKIASFEDLAVDEACKMFLLHVLPRVDTFQLSERTERRFSLFRLHPLYRRVAQGYEYKPGSLMYDRFVLKPGVDIHKVSEFQKSNATPSILIDDPTVERRACVGYNVNIGPEASSLFSLVVSTDRELVVGHIRSLEEVHRRLRAAKQNFEDTASLAPVRTRINDLLYNISVFTQVRNGLCRVVGNSKKY
ncbi:hypothetical protein KR018_007722 [Drosophila ironensis]|nr:hypothetical protein KR018_007722 [Drosophila ironensis]